MEYGLIAAIGWGVSSVAAAGLTLVSMSTRLA